MTATQSEIKLWFDEVYKERGFNYLRPLEAYEIFVSLLSPTEGSNFLDVACGLGLMLKAMSNAKSVVHGIDISSEAIRRTKAFCPEAFLIEGNAERIPYEDETFDYVSCIGSLERMINRPKALAEQLRVAKNDARFVYMVRNSENFTWKYFLKPFGLENKQGHQDAMNLDQWKTLFESNGFKIKRILPDHWPYYRLMKLLKPWSKIDTGKIIEFPFNLKVAYEFIFLLEKA